jgi:hypothetical protein
MTTISIALPRFRVVHPLDDVPEAKCSPEALGKMAMTPAVRISLLLLRSYLLVMVALVFYRVVDLSGAFGG